MTRKEKEKILLDALGIKVGDIVTINHLGDFIYNLKVVEEEYCYRLVGELEYHKMNVIILVVDDYKIVTSKKRLGNLTCSECKCDECPLCTSMCNRTSSDDKLYYGLERAKEDKKINDKVYSLFKEILDEEID